MGRPLEDILRSDTLRRFREIGDELGTHLYEREEAIRIVLIAFLIRHNVIFISSPGTAKSELLHLLCRAIEGARYFKIQLFKQTPPDFVFGPVDLKALDENKELRYKTEGFLPSAHVALIDEFYDANQGVLTGMVSITHPGEREFSNGSRVEACPTISVVSGTNFVPNFHRDEEEDLLKVHDRFLFRMDLPPIEEEDNFLRMLASKPPKGLIKKIRLDELERLQQLVGTVEVPSDVSRLVWDLRQALKKAEIWVSDRRWQWSMDALRGAAFYEGRPSVRVDDLLILRHVLWSSPDEQEKVMDLILQVVFPHLHEALKWEKAAQDALQTAKQSSNGADKRREQSSEIRKIQDKILALLHNAPVTEFERDHIMRILAGIKTIEDTVKKILSELESQP